jgi:hypothetical protein
MTTLTHKVNNSHLGCCVTSQLTMAAIGYWDVVLFGTTLMLDLEIFAVKLTFSLLFQRDICLVRNFKSKK